MSTIPFLVRRASAAPPALTDSSTFDREAAPSAVNSQKSLALDVVRYVLVTVVGPAAAVLALAAVLAS